MLFSSISSKALKQLSLPNRETGALCAMKEVELFPDDPNSAECIKQLEQVGYPLLVCYHSLSVNRMCYMVSSACCPCSVC